MANPGEVKNHGIMLWSVGGIFGYAAFGFIGDWIGRRLTVALQHRVNRFWTDPVSGVVDL